MSRERLPDRRPAVAQRLLWDGHAFELAVGFDDAGLVRELFIDGHKIGSAMRALFNDVAVVVSRGLQHGDRIADMAKGAGCESVGRRPSSLLGVMLRAAEAIEAGLPLCSECSAPIEAGERCADCAGAPLRRAPFACPQSGRPCTWYACRSEVEHGNVRARIFCAAMTLDSPA